MWKEEQVWAGNLRFLDISILFGTSGATDLLVFESSPIPVQMDSPNFVAPGLCLFSDNAYINRRFMATPISNLVVQHTENRVDKDAYNLFYHSQLRINIECAFGILVNRFGWLRKQAPVQYTTIKKTMATASCLCKLHNFLIDCTRLGIDNTVKETIAEMTPQDELNLAVEGGVPLEGVGTSQDVLRHRITQIHGDHIPRACLLNHVMERGLYRPVHNLERNGSSR